MSIEFLPTMYILYMCDLADSFRDKENITTINDDYSVSFK